MKRQRVFLTGATGAMGFLSMQELLQNPEEQEVVILARPSEKNKTMLAPFENRDGLTIRWGDLTNYEDVYACVDGADVILHVAAFVSPAADYYPGEAMKINFGSTRNLIRAVYEQKRENDVRFVYIGTVAETGDRMPPIHWGRVGDPIKPSVYDYYAVSKIAAERLVIESGLKHWVSLRQTGIIGPKMSEIDDAIMFHNCLDNVLEYVSDRDSAILLKNLCSFYRSGTLDEEFWGHIYNIGGGPGCRTSTFDMYKVLFGALGFTDLSKALLDAEYYGTRNFHGQYYLDSDKLEAYLHFRHDSMQYYYDCYLKQLGPTVKTAQFITKLPGGQKLIGGAMKKRFMKTARTEHGTMRFIEQNLEDQIAAYWGSKEAMEAIPPLKDFEHFTDWDTVIEIDHGYDESKPESELSLEDVRQAAAFRGGECLSDDMQKGDWSTKLKFRCAFGHEFEASPRLVLEGGHWCPDCERESWNYQNRAKVDPFFAQVWYPLHPNDETARVYPKAVSELDITGGEA
ncbi:MAG TPA: NAD(P)-dependent oxidoreductase [Eubacteriales bacterium]|nr:NAD(P)-dependent oxidoreductase [Eubacteriales bacterium]